MKKCCNFFCAKQAREDSMKKAKTLKFILSKDGCQKVQDNEVAIAFCDGTLASKGESLCKINYFKIKDQVKNINEGGPFGTPMKKLADVLRGL